MLAGCPICNCLHKLLQITISTFPSTKLWLCLPLLWWFLFNTNWRKYLLLLGVISSIRSQAEILKICRVRIYLREIIFGLWVLSFVLKTYLFSKCGHCKCTLYKHNITVHNCHKLRNPHSPSDKIARFHIKVCWRGYGICVGFRYCFVWIQILF